MEKLFKEGVYIKPNGGLVVLEKFLNDNPNRLGWKYKWSLMDGRKSTNKILNALIGGAPYLELETYSDNELYDAWGPSNYLKRCEYLSEL